MILERLNKNSFLLVHSLDFVFYWKIYIGVSYCKLNRYVIFNLTISHSIFIGFQKRSSHNILKIANNIFVADSFNINFGFQNIATNNFKSEVKSLSFVRPALAAQTINNWIASKTNNKIDKLLSSGNFL